jgi:diguanylate cyclase (GGDEF)-like protein
MECQIVQIGLPHPTFAQHSGSMSTGSLRLLVVEDNPGDVRLLREMLAGTFEAEIVVAGSLQAARSALAEHEFDCALIDLSLPDADGLEVLDVLSTDASTVPVVIISGLADERFALRAVQAGAQDYLLKAQFNEHSIGRTIRYAIERKSLDRELSQLALYDALTGLPNRALYLDRLGVALARASRSGTELAVLHLDLDDFHAVNDQVGYEAGDAVLIEVGRRLEGAVPSPDTVARIGGDSFACVLEVRAEPEIQLASGRILEALAPPIAVDRDVMEIEASIGRAIARPDDSPEALLQRAAVAMHLDKGRQATAP